MIPLTNLRLTIMPSLRCLVFQWRWRGHLHVWMGAL